MEWGIVLAFPTVLGMLMLIFAGNNEAEYQTFGQTVVNPPAMAKGDEVVELKEAA